MKLETYFSQNKYPDDSRIHIVDEQMYKKFLQGDLPLFENLTEMTILCANINECKTKFNAVNQLLDFKGSYISDEFENIDVIIMCDVENNKKYIKNIVNCIKNTNRNYSVV